MERRAIDREGSFNKKLIDDFNAISETHIDVSNRFVQRSVTEGFLSENVCNIIVSSANKVGEEKGWTTKRHDNYPTTDLPLSALPNSVQSIVLCRVIEILDKAKVLYCLPDTCSMNVKDIFVVKYAPSQQSILGMHCDGHILTFQITLSLWKTMKVVQIYGCTVKPNKGALTIQSGFVKHAGVPITKGVRYVLVGFELLVV